jgi:phosphatidylinositol glycan class M
LLALLLTPNSWLHPSFGKYIFALCDIVNGVLIYQLLRAEILKTRKPPNTSPNPKNEQSRGAPADSTERMATIYSAVHLLNPLIFSISTRGSSESVLSLFVLLTLYAALKKRWDTAAILLGLSTHWKIYPIIYGAGCLGVISESGHDRRNWRGYLQTIVNWKTIRFTAISAGTFLLLGASCYAM